MKKIIYFTSPRCGPCAQFKPIIESLSSRLPIQTIDVDSNPNAPELYGVLSVPTTILMKDNREVSRFTGTRTTNQILNWYNNE